MVNFSFCCRERNPSQFSISFSIGLNQICPEIEQLIHSLPYVSSPEASCMTRNCSSVQCASIAEVKFWVPIILSHFVINNSFLELEIFCRFFRNM